MAVNPLHLAVVLMLLGGAFVAVQAPTNAVLARGLGSPVNAALVSFLVGTLALGLTALLLRARPEIEAMRALPAWAWIGGLYGAFFVAAAAYAAPKIGVAATLTLTLAGQLAAAVALDHFGALGLPKQEITWPRLAGVALVVAGVVLVRRY